MNILVPLSSSDPLDAFCQAGADEFYIGFYDTAWDTRFGSFEEINRMSSFGSQANFPIQELEKLVTQIHIRGKKVFVTLNSAAYSFDQILWIDSYVEQLKAFSIDGIILGSLELLCHLRGCGLPLSMSTMGGTYNSGIISFYQDLGVKRIILPRDITLRDMEKIVSQFPGILFEAFLMRNGCKYSDANCMSYHSRKCGSMCATLDIDSYTIETNPAMKTQDVREIHANHTLFTKAFHKRTCGLCVIDDLLNIGISSVKIVGRADRFDSVIADIKQVRTLIDAPGHSRMSINENCLYQLNCYYNCNHSQQYDCCHIY